MNFQRVFTFVIATGGIVLAVTPYRPLLVVGESMDPTFHNLSLTWGTKQVGALKDGDVVVVDSPEGRIIKRIALMPGERHWQLKTRVGWADVDRVQFSNHCGPKYRELTVPKGKMYLLGDNPTMSMDSRYYGYFDIRDVRLVVSRSSQPTPDAVAKSSGRPTNSAG